MNETQLQLAQMIAQGALDLRESVIALTETMNSDSIHRCSCLLTEVAYRMNEITQRQSQQKGGE